MLVWFPMNLQNYLASTTQSAFAEMVGVSQGMIHQWAAGIRPVSAEQCVVIERVTGGEVTRQELRPTDWHLIWPELVNSKAA